MLTTLPEDVLCLILQHIGFQGKCRMQLVCRKFSALLSSPPQGLWGRLNLMIHIGNRKRTDKISRQVLQDSTLLRMP